MSRAAGGGFGVPRIPVPCDLSISVLHALVVSVDNCVTVGLPQVHNCHPYSPVMLLVLFSCSGGSENTWLNLPC